MTPHRPSEKPLDGLRLVVTAIDLEQAEHRGIAVYSKSLIRCLKQAGADVWLLTQLDTPTGEGSLRRLPAATREVIRNARVLNGLSEGQLGGDATWISHKLPWARRWVRLQRLLNDLRAAVFSPQHYPARRLRSFQVHSQLDNPYLRHERLGYLQNLDGVICARNLFLSSLWKAHRQQGPVSLDLSGFDALITTCPLHLRPSNGCTFVQTVHDLIPLEYAQTSDNVSVFARRLAACLPARRLHVSESTQQKFNAAVLGALPERERASVEPRDQVAIQPPSLQFPQWLFGTGESSEPSAAPPADVPPSSYLLREAAAGKGARPLSLKPFRYLLFNSSVEPRKNLLFLVQAYVESNLSSQGIQLCVTGKLKRDDYSAAVREIVKHEPGILLTGYINESTKHDLYLNSLALLSPSLVEGFGIPVLDAACLGMPALASDCASHRQIQGLYDFSSTVLLCNTLESGAWARAMQALTIEHGHWADRPVQERQRRLQRYNQLAPQVTQRFSDQICQLLTG